MGALDDDGSLGKELRRDEGPGILGIGASGGGPGRGTMAEERREYREEKKEALGGW